MTCFSGVWVPSVPIVGVPHPRGSLACLPTGLSLLDVFVPSIMCACGRPSLARVWKCPRVCRAVF